MTITSDFCMVFIAFATIWCFWSTSSLIYLNCHAVKAMSKDIAVKIGIAGGFLYTGALYGLSMFVVLLFGG